MDVNMLLGMIGSSQPQSMMGKVGNTKTGQGDLFAGLLQQMSQDGKEEYAQEIAFSPAQLMNMMQLGKTAKVSDTKDNFTDLLQQVSLDDNAKSEQQISFSPMQLMEMMKNVKTDRTNQVQQNFDFLSQQVKENVSESDGKATSGIQAELLQLIQIGGNKQESTDNNQVGTVKTDINQNLDLKQSSNTKFALEQLLAILKTGMLTNQKSSMDKLFVTTSDDKYNMDKLFVTTSDDKYNMDKLVATTSDDKYKWLADLQVSPQTEVKKIMDDLQNSDAITQMMAMLLLPQYQQPQQQTDVDLSQVTDAVNSVKSKELAQGFLGKVFAKVSDVLQQQDLTKGKIDISNFQQIVETAVNDVAKESKQAVKTSDQVKSEDSIANLIGDDEAFGKELAKKIVLYVDHEVNKLDRGLDPRNAQFQIVPETTKNVTKATTEQNTDFFGKESEKHLKKDAEIADKLNTSPQFAPVVAESINGGTQAATEVTQKEATTLPPKEEIIQQIVDKASFHKDKAVSEMHIQLNPEHLGNVTMKIRIEAGTVSAQFLIDNQQTKDIVQANIPELKQALAEQGIKVNQVDVALGGHNFMQHQSEGKDQGRWGQQKSKSVKGIAAKDAIDEIEKNQTLINPIMAGTRKFLYRDVPRMSFDSMA